MEKQREIESCVKSIQQSLESIEVILSETQDKEEETKNNINSMVCCKNRADLCIHKGYRLEKLSGENAPVDEVEKTMIPLINQYIQRLEDLIRDVREEYPGLSEEDILGDGLSLEYLRKQVQDIECSEEYVEYKNMIERLKEYIRSEKELLEAEKEKIREENRKIIKDVLLKPEERRGCWVNTSVRIHKETGKMLPISFNGAYSSKMQELSQVYGVGMCEKASDYKLFDFGSILMNYTETYKEFELTFKPFKECSFDQKSKILEREGKLKAYQEEIKRGEDRDYYNEIISIVLPVDWTWGSIFCHDNVVKVDITRGELIMGGILPEELAVFLAKNIVERANSTRDEMVYVGGRNLASRSELRREGLTISEFITPANIAEADMKNKLTTSEIKENRIKVWLIGLVEKIAPKLASKFNKSKKEER